MAMRIGNRLGSRRPVAAAVAATALLAVSGCGAATGSAAPASSAKANSASSPAAPGGTITIGWLGGLTGLLAEDAANAKAGTQFAVDQVNAHGGVDGKRVQVIYEDTSTDPEKARTATQQLILQDHVAGIIGDYYSPNVLAMEPLLQQYQVPAISYDGVADKVTHQGNQYIFRTPVSNRASAAAIGHYLVYTLHLKRFLLIGGTDAYSQNNMDDFAAYVKAHGGTVVAIKSYNPVGTKDFSPYLLPYKHVPFDALFLGGSPADNALIIKQFRQLGFKQLICSTTGIDRPIISQADGAAAAGAVMAIDVPEMAVNGDQYATQSARAWEQAWLKAGHQRLDSYDGAHAYDATMILLKALAKTKGATGPALRQAILAVGHNYSGASGRLTLLPTGSAEETQYIMQWGPNGQHLHIIGVVPVSAAFPAG